MITQERNKSYIWIPSTDKDEFFLPPRLSTSIFPATVFAQSLQFYHLMLCCLISSCFNQRLLWQTCWFPVVCLRITFDCCLCVVCRWERLTGALHIRLGPDASVRVPPQALSLGSKLLCLHVFSPTLLQRRLSLRRLYLFLGVIPLSESLVRPLGLGYPASKTNLNISNTRSN